jgi:hypothetical protein
MDRTPLAERGKASETPRVTFISRAAIEAEQHIIIQPE